MTIPRVRDGADKELRDALRCQKIMALLEAAVRRGERAPTNEQIQYMLADGFWGVAPYMKMLRDMGQIRVDVYASNWRVVTILVGELKGQHTMKPVGRGKPYRILGASPVRAGA